MARLLRGTKARFQRYFSTALPNKKKPHDFLGIAFFGSLCLLTTGLGAWQLSRYEWKVNLIEDTKKKANEPPIDIGYDELFADSEGFRGRRMLVKGTFDHSREVLLGPRSAPVGIFGPSAQGLATNPQGSFVITPFKLDCGKEIFINRGWVPRNTTSWNRPEGTISLTAVLTTAEDKTPFSPKNDPSSKKLYWLERESLLAASGKGAEEKFVLMDVVGDNSSAASKEGPYAKSLNIIHEHYVQPITHLTYAVTWFSLSAFGVFMTYKKFRPKTIRRR